MLRSPISNIQYPISSLIVFTLCIAAIISSLLFANLKRAALAYDELDYAFYAQFAARVADPQLTDAYSAQPQGFNFIGHTGIEGKDNIHQAIHFELIKYVYVFLYWLIPNPLFIIFFIAVVYFSPVVYIAFIHPAKSSTEHFFILGFALFYLGFPSVFQIINYELRPRIFLIPFLVLAIFAIHYQRPMWEKLLFFGLIFLVREEALIFGLALILFNFVQTPAGKERTLSTAGFGLIWPIFFFVIRLYYDWTGYLVDPTLGPLGYLRSNPTVFIALIAGGLLLAGLTWFVWLHARNNPQRQSLLEILSSIILFLPLSAPLLTDIQYFVLVDSPTALDIFNRLFFSPNITIYFVAVFVFLVLVKNTLKTSKSVTAANYFLLTTGLILVVINLTELPATIREYQARAEAAEIVFQIRSETDLYHTKMLTDYYTYQAFFDYEYVTLFQRIPWKIAGENRYYPENLPHLQQILDSGMDFIVIGIENRQEIQELLDASNIQPVRVIENEQYQIIQLP